MKNSTLGIIGLLWIACMAMPAAQADIAALETAQGNESSLIHHWTFEGADDAARRADKAGSYDLVQVYEAGFVGPTQKFVQAFDSSSMGTQSYTYYTNRHIGSSLAMSSSSLVMPTNGTMEFISYATTNNTFGISVGGSAAGDNRWYFLQDNYFKVGPNESIDLFPGKHTTNWYYVAVTWDMDATSGDTTLNGYYAHLGTGTFELVHAATNRFKTVDNPAASILLGIGSRSDNGDYLDGIVDSVALYDSILGESSLESHLNAIPEPASLVFLAMGGLLLLRRRR